MMITITPAGGTPAEQIHDQIRGLITTGQLAADERLPSVRQLAADLGVAPGTVAKAYKALESEALLITRIGAGTRVRRGAVSTPASVVAAARNLSAAGRAEGLELEEIIRIVRAMW